MRRGIRPTGLSQNLLAANARRHTLSLFAQVPGLFLQMVCQDRGWLNAALFHGGTSFLLRHDHLRQRMVSWSAGAIIIWYS
jgi:hypothetical protein